ncbi:MAG: lipase family protein [Spirochaetes bacterium]|nr:lipase family protein [Spirochaetota bacterium]
MKQLPYFLKALAFLIFISCINTENKLNEDIASITGTYFQPTKITFRGFINSEYEFTRQIYYSDCFFYTSSYIYNHDLARLSLLLALASASAVESDAYWGANGLNPEDTFGRDANLRNALQNLGFTNYTPNNYNISLNNSESKVAFSIAERKLFIGGKVHTLLAVVIRGRKYGAQWANNFYVGNNGKYHEGFYRASLDVLSGINSFIANNAIKKPVKIWITGFSRGGAVANLTAAALNTKFDPHNIFAYVFAAPNNIIFNDDADRSLHNNIFNIIHPSDIIHIFPLRQWNFSRYGVNLFFPAGNNIPPELTERVNQIYRELVGEDYPFIMFPDTLEIVEWLLNELAPSTEIWVNRWQNILKAYAKLRFNRIEVQTDDTYISWEAGNITDRFIHVFGAENLSSFHELIPLIMQENNFDNNILAHINVFLSIARMNNMNILEMFRFIRRVTTAMNFIRASLSVYIDTGHINAIIAAHFPEVYYAWMFALDSQDMNSKTL